MLNKQQKKGSIVDIAFFLVVILGLAIFILIVGKIYPEITNQIKQSDIGDNANSVEALDTTEYIAGKGDMVFIFIFSGLIMAVLITSFFIDSSPILIPVYIISLGLLIIFSVVSENVYDSFSTNPSFSTVAATQPIAAFIMTHLVMVSIGVGVLSMILIFAKPRGYGGGF